MTYLQKAINDGHVEIYPQGKREVILYKKLNHKEIYSDPEEKVRAEFWAELVYRYQYPIENIGIEITIPDRTPSDRADIVIFNDKTHKSPYLVVECKKEGITDNEFNQAVEQVCGNGTWAKFKANYVIVVAGNTRRALDFTDKYGVLEREKNIIADVPIRYGKPQEYKYYKGSSLDISPVSKEDLISAIRKCHQTLWGGGKLSPPTAFSELCKLIFVKISDEQQKRKGGEPYSFQIKTHETSAELSNRIKDLYLEHQKRDPDVFTETIKIADATLLTVVSHLENINLSKTDLDTKGVAFEQFMDGFFKGDYGQYFTPRELIEFCIDVLTPTNDDIILDPACGSGGFLLHALDSVRKEANQYYEQHTAENFKLWHDFAKNNLFGIEINDEIARVTKMNMIIHDDGHTNVIGTDSLEGISKINKINPNFSYNKFDFILTNPPFGSKVKLSEHEYLENYDFGIMEKSNGKTEIRKTQKSEILFIEVVHRFLKPNTGQTAIVLPDSILTNETLQYVRDWLFERFRIIGIASLPESAFAHFGTSVKASILFLRKYGNGEKILQDYEIIMSTPKKVGYTSTGREDDNELPIVSKQINAFIANGYRFENKSVKKKLNLSDFSNHDKEVLKIVGKTDVLYYDETVFKTNFLIIDGPINPERYKALWLEVVFEGKLLIDYCDLIQTKTTPSKNDKFYDLIRIDDLENRPIIVDSVRTQHGSELEGAYFKTKENDILLARLGPTMLNKKIVLSPKTKNTTICSTEFLVLRPKKNISPYAILSILKTDLYRNLMYSKGRGATPSRYRLIKSDLEKLPFPNIDNVMTELRDLMEDKMNRTIELREVINRMW